MQLSDAVKEFILECEVRNYTPKTIKGYRNAAKMLARYLETDCGITEIEDIKPPHIKKFMRSLQQAGRKPSYLNGFPLKKHHLKGDFKNGCIWIP